MLDPRLTPNHLQAQEGLTPRAVCDKYFLKHKAIYDWFDIRCERAAEVFFGDVLELE